MTQNIYLFSTHEIPQLSEVGGKAQSLIRSTQAGLQVPEGLALSVAFFQPWTDQIKSTEAWKALLANPVRENCDQVKALAGKLTLTDDQRTQLDSALAQMSDMSVFAVRS